MVGQAPICRDYDFVHIVRDDGLLCLIDFSGRAVVIIVITTYHTSTHADGSESHQCILKDFLHNFVLVIIYL